MARRTLRPYWRPVGDHAGESIEPMTAADLADVWKLVMQPTFDAAGIDLPSWREWAADFPELLEDQPVPAPSWAARNKLVLIILVILAIALAEPAIAEALPRELRDYLGQDAGPLTFALVLVGAITGTAAVTGKKSD